MKICENKTSDTKISNKNNNYNKKKFIYRMLVTVFNERYYFVSKKGAQLLNFKRKSGGLSIGWRS